MITENWRELIAKEQAKKPDVRFVFIEMRRPEPGVVYFEAPEVELVVRYETDNFAPMLKRFVDEEVAPRLKPSHHTTVDLILVDPAWKSDEFAGEAQA